MALHVYAPSAQKTENKYAEKPRTTMQKLEGQDHQHPDFEFFRSFRPMSMSSRLLGACLTS